MIKTNCNECERDLEKIGYTKDNATGIFSEPRETSIGDIEEALEVEE